jgi:hypothetical protein
MTGLSVQLLPQTVMAEPVVADVEVEKVIVAAAVLGHATCVVVAGGIETQSHSDARLVGLLDQVVSVPVAAAVAAAVVVAVVVVAAVVAVVVVVEAGVLGAVSAAPEIGERAAVNVEVEVAEKSAVVMAASVVSEGDELEETGVAGKDGDAEELVDAAREEADVVVNPKQQSLAATVPKKVVEPARVKAEDLAAYPVGACQTDVSPKSAQKVEAQ